MVSRGEVDHLRGRLPGFAAGGAAGAPVFQGGGTPVGRPAFGTFVNPIGRGLVPERVDMGVDYGGSGPLFALGSGTITSVYNSGWPGGTFIDLRLQPTLGSGFWFYAENISPLVRLGQAVAAGQLVGRATGGPSGIEVGWASGRGGQTMAAASGQATAGQRRGDPGFFPTAWGVAASNLIASLGGPAGIIRGPVQGGTAGPGFLLPAVLKLISGLARFATMGAGGAGGILKDILLRIPAMLVKAAENWVSKHILAPAGTAGPANADAAQAQAYAKSQLARYGWDMTQWPPLNSLWTHESNWNRLATNAGRPYAPYGVAYGIPQALPAIKMGPLANPPTSSAAAQIDWGLGYIKGRYGSPAAAWAFDVNNGMKGYARGGRVGVLASPMPPPTRAYVRDLERFQARATRDYGGLRRALEHDLVRGGAGTWDWQHRTSIRTGLEKLKRAEFAERAAVYQLLTGRSGINQRTLSAFRKVLAAEEKAAADPDLGSWVTMTEHGRHVRHAHGHPGWASGLRWWLKELGQLTAHMPAAWESPRPGSMPLAPHLSTLAGAYSFDRGNTLPPGYSISYNGLGRPEALVPADSMPAHVTIVVENHGVLGGRAEVGNWLAGEIDRLARQGRLTYALRRSVSAS
jgi:hypothetical protein